MGHSWPGNDLQIWASLQRDATLDLREICLRLGSFNPFSVQGNTLWGQGGTFPEQPIASGQLSHGSQSQTRLSALVPGPGRSTALQSIVPAQALALCWCQGLQLARGQGLSCPCSTGRALKSPACWEVWLSISVLECHRHVSINFNMNCMNWSCSEGCSACIFLWD